MVLLCVSRAGVMGFVPGARGQSETRMAMAAKPDTPNPADQGWRVDVAPYLWFPGISGTVGVAGHETGVHVTGSDVLSYVNFGIMGAADIRYNRIIMPVDFMWQAYRRQRAANWRETRAEVGRGWTIRSWDCSATGSSE